MACLIVPGAEAIFTTIMTKVVASREKKEGKPEALQGQGGNAASGVSKIPFSRKLRWLSNLLWGGSALLAFEHVWHGEIVPWFPFLTAVGNPADTAAMLHEMATAGVAMSVLVTAVWAVMLVVVGVAEKKALKAQAAEK
jgi:hypothetical protein